MATSGASTSETAEQLSKPEYRNWLALGHALTTVLCQGLRPFITREIVAFHNNVTALTAGRPCTCVHVPRRRPNEFHDMSTCALANILEGHHHRHKPNWKQSDPAKWMDPVLGPWEIAKLFLPDLGGHADIKSADDMDITGILNLMYWCNHFTIPQHLIQVVRETRNNKWVHVPKLELTNADKTDAFAAIANLLKDRQLALDPAAQRALTEIVNLRNVSDLRSLEAQVLADFKEVLIREIQQSETTQKEVEQLRRLVRVLENRLEVLEQRNWFFVITVIQTLKDLHRNLVRGVKGIRRQMIVLWVMIYLFCSFFVILNDDTVVRDECSTHVYSGPSELKYFDFSDFINSSRAEFIGRQWLYRELESVLEHTNKRGVLITGNPGSGKSAFLSNLLCSNTSSPIIHNRILGYHFCMHFNKWTKSGANFVGNLATMIAWRITEYHQVILTDVFVRRVLTKDCSQDPEWCFQQAILKPLTKLQQQPTEPWYFVIDALDECADAKAEILNILKSKVRLFPKWLKLIVSSRNVTSIVVSLEELQRVDLRSSDRRNLEDIDTYISLKVFPLKESIVHRIKTVLAITDNDTPTQKIVSSLAEKGQGNFLYVKVVLDLWLSTTDTATWDTFPKTLGSSYQFYFERKYATPESFQPLRQIFEVLVAAFTPLTLHEMHSLLSLDNPTLDLEYEFMPKLDQVSSFLYGSGDGLIRIYHTSLSEWLTSRANKGRFYYIKKQNGHNRLARYYLKNTVKNNSPLKPEEAFHLASHIVKGGLDDSMVQQFLSLPPTHINTTDPVTRTTALHHSSGCLNAEVTSLLLYHFSNIDSLDEDQRTPSFIAATSGRLDNLKILFEKGANLNHTLNHLDSDIVSNSEDPVSECKRRLCGYSLLHTAAQEGNTDVVKFLIRHNVLISRTTGANNTAIQLAAANGHLHIVQTLKKAGGILDGISLHHAAARGNNRVVQYLLKEGMKDNCVHNIVFSDQEDRELKKEKLYFYDNRHLYLRETALHAAVRGRHISVMESLLNESESAINCTNSAGRLPLHEAVHTNDYSTLEALLASGANVSALCKSEITPTVLFEPFLPDNEAQNHCPCGFSALHIAAMYGYHSAAELLIKYGANVSAGDCSGATPLHIASCHSAVSLVSLLVKNGADIDAGSLNGSTPLHSAAACFAKAVFRPLFDLGCDCFTTDNEGMTALHYVVKEVDAIGSEHLVDLYARKPKNWIDNGKDVSQKATMSERKEQYPWLVALIELVVCSATTRKFHNTPFVSIKDKKNKSVWDKLLQKTNVSYVLLGSNQFGGGLFVNLLTPFGFAYDFVINENVKSKHEDSTKFIRHIARFLLRTFPTLFPDLTNCSVLLKWVTHNFIYTMNGALQLGLDVNCRDVSGLTPLLLYLRTGGRHMSKVLVKHNVEMKIACGDPFENSVFHLASYHKLHYLHYLAKFLRGSNSWQQYLQTEDAIFDYFIDRYDDKNYKGNVESIRTGDGPLTLAILTHPKGAKVIDECFDAEGYNPLHRAAQGANLIAIQKYLSLGANPFLKTSNGFSPLWLSVRYAIKYRPFLHLEIPSALTDLEVELASLSASALLTHILQYTTLNIGCDRRRSDLTLYHIAASRGMWQLINQLLSSDGIIGIDINCPNKDGITPMYLAKFFGGDSCERDSPWCKVVEVIKSFGGNLQHPTIGSEYFLVNRFYKRFATKLYLDLPEQELALLLVNDCQTDVDVLIKSRDFERICSDYQTKRDKCVELKKDCPTENLRLPHLDYVLGLLDDHRITKSSFFLIRTCFTNSLDDEIKQVMELLLYTFKSPSDVSTRDFLKRWERQLSKLRLRVRDDPEFYGVITCLFGRQGMGLHDWYLTYKRLLDFVLEDLNQVKSVISRTLPRYLAKMYTTLRNFETALKCDWKAVSVKYVQLEFYLRNLQLVWNYHQTSLSLITSEFLSSRIKNVLLRPSRNLLELMLKLASNGHSDSFSYLEDLAFHQPPLWQTNDKTFYE